MLHITVTDIDSSQLWREQKEQDRAALTYALRREFEHVLLPWWQQPENKGKSMTSFDIAVGLALPPRRDMESCRRRISAWLDNELIEVDNSAKPIVNGRPRILYRLSQQAYWIVRRGPKTLAQQMEQNKARNPKKVRSKRKGPDMPTLYEVWIAFLGDRKLTKKSIGTYERLIENCLWDYHLEPITAWTPELVEQTHDDMTKTRGPCQANMVMRLLSSLINYSALKFGIAQFRTNPVKRLSALRKWNKENRRTNRLKINEYGAYLTALNGARSGSSIARCSLADLYELLLFTGMRRDEGRLLTWEDVNFAERYFKIPDTKNRRTHVLPMSEHVFDLFRRRWMQQKPNERKYVFPGRLARQPIAKGTLTLELPAIERRICPHDLRRSFAAAGKKSQVSTEVIGQLLNHMTTSLTLRYMGDDDIEELREPMERISQFILHHASIPTDVFQVTVMENAPLLIQDRDSLISEK